MDIIVTDYEEVILSARIINYMDSNYPTWRDPNLRTAAGKRAKYFRDQMVAAASFCSAVRFAEGGFLGAF